MSENEKLLFGATLDDVPEEDMEVVIDDVFYQMELDGFDEDEWEWLVWHRGETCYILMYGPLMARTSLLKVDGVERTRPPAHTARDMMDNRNTWYYPLQRRKSTMTAAESAASLFQKWQGELFAAVKSDDAAAEEPEKIHEVSSLPLPRRRRKTGAAINAVPSIKLLNLEDAVDEDGKKFVFGNAD